MSGPSDCVFCGIVAGDLPSHRVFEDDTVVALMDAFPAAPGHVLVVPKAHFTDLLDIDDAAVAAVALVARRVARAIDAALAPDGLTVTQANRVAAGQSVMHYHVHLIPRAAGRSMRLHGTGPGDPEALAGLARAISAALEAPAS